MFDRLRVYQASVLLLEEVQKLIREHALPEDLADHLERAARSVKLNVSESAGFRFNGKKIVAYEIARGSTDEVRSCLQEIRARGLAEAHETRRAFNLARVIAKMLTAMMKEIEKQLRKTEPRQRSKRPTER